MEAVQDWLANSELAARLRAGLERQLERLQSLPAEFAVQAMNLRIVDIVQGAEAASRQPTPANLSEIDAHSAGIVEALVRDGVYTSTLDAFGIAGSDDLLEHAGALAARMTERSLQSAGSPRHTLTATADDFQAFPRLLHWGLEPRLLDIVEAYLGVPAAFDGSLFFHSRADGRENGVRVWHRDREDSAMLKVAIYVNDVGDDGGPFQLLSPDLQRQVDDRISWRYAALKQAELDRLLRRRGASQIRNITGPRGTIIIVDTARFHHRGKPPTRRERSALFYTYFRRSPRHPFCCERSPLSRRQLADFAATVHPRGRDCLLWRDQLPLARRLIPPNRLSV